MTAYRNRWNQFCFVLIILLDQTIAQSPLFPSLDPQSATFKPIVASATCGLVADEFCDGDNQCLNCDNSCPFIEDPVFKTTGPSVLIQPECRCAGAYTFQVGQLCCTDETESDCVSRINEDSHPVQFINDDNDQSYWRGPTDQDRIDITLDLGIEHEILSVKITFAKLVPYAMVLMKSLNGQDYSPYQFFSQDCDQSFSMTPDDNLNSPEDVNCISTFSSARRTEVEFETLSSTRTSLANAEYIKSEELQRFTRARYLRIGLRKLHTAETAKDIFGNSLPTEPFYRITSVDVTSRCSCNGHASSCIFDANTQTGICDCQHNTAGTNCEECDSFFNAKSWVRGGASDALICEACECNDHADSCSYNQALDTNPTSRTEGNGGECINCQDNTIGQFCETCQDSFYENPDSARDASDACLPCSCNSDGTKASTKCDIKTGQCECKSNVQGPNCDQCKDNFYGLSSSHDEGCIPCQCNVFGTDNLHLDSCDSESGQCQCKNSNEGRDCSKCSMGFFAPAGAEVGQCQQCDAQCDESQGCVGPGPSNCVACKGVEDNGACVEECPPGKYDDMNHVCQPCHNQCLNTCSGPGSSLLACDECKNFKNAGFCVAVCPPQMYADSENECQSCHPLCSECTGPNTDQCQACTNAFFESKCVDSCPVGTYRDTSGICRVCSQQCSGLDGCLGPLSSDCYACKNFLDKTQSSETCVETCPSGSYSTIQDIDGVLTKVCLTCNSECASDCSGPGADECVGGCQNIEFDGECVSDCPSNFYVSASKRCEQCHPLCQDSSGCTGPLPSDCEVCQSDAYLAPDGSTCVSSCPTGYYGDESNICRQCHEACSECDGPGITSCIKCKKYSFNDQCVVECPLSQTYIVDAASGITIMTTLIPETGPEEDSGDEPDPGVGDPGDVFSPFICKPCNEQCSGGCVDEGPSKCNECKNVQLGDECVPDCPSMTFQIGDLCVACDSECDIGCDGPDPSQCVRCKNLKVEDTCVSECPSNFYANSTLCRECHPRCSNSNPGCTGPDSNDCKECRNVRLDSTQECLPSCPSSTYEENGICYDCHPLCRSCTGPKTNQCPKCRFFEFDGSCVEECPSGTFPDNDKICQRCNFQCASNCFGPDADECLEAANGTLCRFAQRGGECVPFCNADTEYLDSDGMCQSCHPQCEGGCTAAGPQSCLTCKSFKLDDSCVTSCPPASYFDGAKRCFSCHPECGASANGTVCTGPEASQCGSCLNLKDGNKCVSSCPIGKTPVNGICQNCHSQCDGGCTGIGPDQCLQCKAWKHLDTCVAECPADSTYPNPDTLECEACHPQCSTELGSGGCPLGIESSHCTVCLHYRQNGICVDSCDVDEYPKRNVPDAVLGSCRKCDESCVPSDGCSGPGPGNCVTCLGFELASSCVDECPSFTFINNKLCRQCDPNCLFGCVGAGADECQRLANQFITNSTTLGCRSYADITNGVVTCVASCPLGKYPDELNICQTCHSSCSPSLGCDAPGPSGCNACPGSEYLDSDKTCKACSPQCQGGCTGPTDSDCLACKGARLNGACVSSCAAVSISDGPQYYTDRSQDEPTCRPCHPECADGGCSGPNADQCLGGCDNFQDFTSKSCISSCRPDQFSNTFNECLDCSPVCRGGCTDATDMTCTQCDVAKLPSGKCVSECPGAQEIGSDGICFCPTDRAFVDGTGECQSCSIECTQGCFGSRPDQCINIPEGCRVASMNGECTPSCGKGMVVVDHECVCPKGSFASDDGTCQACHSQCNGCSGPGSSNCDACRNFELSGTCVSSCGLLHSPDSQGFCQLCHIECLGGCFEPQNNKRCVACKNYLDGLDCVADCPTERPFVDQGTCVTACPVARPYYNDTRVTGSDELFMPSTCVASCTSLGIPEKLYVSDTEPFRCSTQLRITSDAQAASAGDLEPESIVAIVLGILAVLLILLAILFVFRRQNRTVELYSGVEHDDNYPDAKNAWSDEGRYFRNAVYVPTMALGAPDPYSLDGENPSPSRPPIRETSLYEPAEFGDLPGTVDETDVDDFDYLMGQTST